MLGFGVSATLFVSLQVERGIEETAVQQFAFTCDQVALKINERIKAYALTLRGGAALFGGSKSVSRHEWRQYVETLRTQDSIPGVQGIGFAELITPDRLASHIARIRGEGFPEYNVRPPGEREIYSAIIYLEPFRDRNLRAFGYDMFSEPVRRSAMEQARDTGDAALSGKVVLVQETEADVQAGTLIYVPVYRNNLAHDTVEQRRAALIGWVYSPYRMNDLMIGILGDWEHREGQVISLQIYDGQEATPSSLLYATKTVTGPNMRELLRQQRIIRFNGREWLLQFERVGSTGSIGYGPAWATLLGGIAISVLLFGLMLSVANTEANAARIANDLTKEIRRREELLTESEYRWRFALEGAGDGVWDWNLAENTVFYSKRWKEMLGFAEDQISDSQDEWEQRIHPHDKSKTLATVQAYLDGKSAAYTCEYRLRCRDGAWKWVLGRGIVVRRSEDGKPLRMIGTLTDIHELKQLNQELTQSRAELQEAQRIAQTGSWQLDLATDRVAWSPELYRIFGLSPDMPPPNYSEQARLFTPESWDRLQDAILDTKTAGTSYKLELEVVKTDGAHGWMLASAEAIRDENQAIIGLRGVAGDITERKRAELKLLAAYAETRRFREALDYVTSFVYMKDTQSRYVYANRTTLELFGVSAAELEGCGDARFFPPNTVKRLREIDSRVFTGEQTTEEVDVVFADGSHRVYLEIKAPIYSDTPDKAIWGLLGISTDITPIKEHEQYLEHIAHYDVLTGLPNRVLLADRLQQTMAQTQRRERLLAVAYIDLDGFKTINDSYGHDAGDQLLMIVASNMKHTLREGDTLARLGGDEFVAVLLDLENMAASVPMLSRLLAAAAEPVDFDELRLQVSASIGVTFFPQGEDVDADQLLRQADQAMYQAKLAGKNNYYIFDTDKDRLTRGLHESVERIRRALFDGELVLYYQPKVNMRLGTVIGVEALIRWQHPDRGLLSPALFLPVIEDNPLAVEVGEWVIETALAQIERWRENGLHISISVNVDAYQLQQSNFVERLRALLAAHPRITPFSLEIEVLETSALADLAQICRVMNECREIGVRFALDDFGTGYSSLTYLKRLSADLLKIDQSFVRDMLDDPEDLAILEGVLGLATAFRRHAIAEGVETVEHGSMLLQLGCELAQGYGIARPMPAAELPNWANVWQPAPGWLGLAALNRSELPLLYAGVEIRAWARAFEASLSGVHDTPPPLEYHQCRFGAWLNAGGLAGRVSPSSLQAIDASHRQLHDLATELIDIKAQGRNQEALARLSEFYCLMDALLEHLKAQMNRG